MSGKLEKLEARLSAVEHELRELKARMGDGAARPWYREIVGAFANNRAYAEITRLGRQIRKSESRKER